MAIPFLPDNPQDTKRESSPNISKTVGFGLIQLEFGLLVEAEVLILLKEVRVRVYEFCTQNKLQLINKLLSVLSIETH